MKAFFKELTGKSQITSNDLRKLDTSYDPSVLGESTKVDYLRVIDILIESRGESFILPLSWPLAASMFPACKTECYNDVLTANIFIICGQNNKVMSCNNLLMSY